MRKDFLWAGATSANQYEGAYREDGRGISNADIITGGDVNHPRRITFAIEEGTYYPSHEATDFYHHYKEDIALFKEMGLKAYRMSISWTRIYPTGLEEKPNPLGLAFYKNVFHELRQNDIEPIVTINHFDMPYELCVRYHGWYSREVIDLYVKLCKTLFEEYKDDVKYWITINEINTTLFPIINGSYEEDLELCGDRQVTQGMLFNSLEDLPDENLNQRRVRALHHQLLGSARVVKLGKSINSEFRFGCMQAYMLMYAYTTDPNDQLLKQQYDEVYNYITSDVQVRGCYSQFAVNYLKGKGIVIPFEEGDEEVLKQGTVDYYTFSYYMTGCVSSREDVVSETKMTFSGLKNRYLDVTDWGFQIDPVGLRISLNNIYGRYHIPVFVAENGLGALDELKDGTVEDDYRIDYLREHIRQLKLAEEEDGVDVFGYAIWGFIDLVSVGTGEHRKRYGLIYVNKDDEGNGNFERYKKKSFYWYQKVIESNGEEL